MNKMRKILFSAALIIVFSLVLCFSVNAQTLNEDGYYFSINDDEATITDIDEATVTGDVVIPDTLGGCPVKALGAYAFQNNNGITSIVIPNGVEIIDRNAFENCGNLVSVTMGDGVETIDQRAFALCRKLQAIRIPAATEIIGASAFALCTSLETVIFEEGALTTIDDYAFTECSRLEAVQFYDGLEYIGERAFYCCSSLTSLIIPGSVERTNYYSFYGCTGLTSVTFNEGFEYVGMSSFANCGTLSEINFPSTLRGIGAYAFENNKYITALDLSSYTILEEIGIWAFSGCIRLAEITLPEQAIYISCSTFNNTSYYNNEENWTDGALTLGNCFLEHEYLAQPDNYGRFIVPNGIKTIAQSAFSDCMFVRSVVIPDSVEIIGMSAFESCDSLSKLYYLADEASWQQIDIYEDAISSDVEIVYNYIICDHEDVSADDGTEKSCSTPGYTAGTFCNDCEEWISGHLVIPAGHSDNNTNGICDLCEKDLSDIALNVVKTITFDEDKYERLNLMFVPKATGKYTLVSMGKVDPEVILYDADMNELAQNDDIGYADPDAENQLWEFNFSLTYTLEKGHVYYWSVFDGYLGSFDILLTFECEHDGGDATCMSPAICQNCGEPYGSIDADAHKWDSGKVTTTATCMVKGVKTYTCQHNSKHTYTENLGLNASNHKNTKNVAEVKATCTNVGYTAGVYCNDCAKYISGHKEIAKNSSNHVNTKNVSAEAASYTKVGYTAGVYCNDCKKYISGHVEIPKLKATFTDSQNAKSDGVNIIMNAGLTQAQLLSLASKGAVIKDKNGNPVDENALVGTGMIIVFPDGKEQVIIVFGDVDGDGKQSAADARLALRASVGLEKYEDDSCYYKAANVGSNDKLSAADARLILRASVGLEKLDIFKKD